MKSVADKNLVKKNQNTFLVQHIPPLSPPPKKKIVPFMR